MPVLLLPQQTAADANAATAITTANGANTTATGGTNYR